MKDKEALDKYDFQSAIADTFNLNVNREIFDIEQDVFNILQNKYILESDKVIDNLFLYKVEVDDKKCFVVENGGEDINQVFYMFENEKDSRDCYNQVLIDERVKLLQLMDNTARCLEDEDLFYDVWLLGGIPDGASKDDLREIAVNEEDFKDIEDCFSRVIIEGTKDGLYNASEEEFSLAQKYSPEIQNYVEEEEEEER